MKKITFGNGVEAPTLALGCMRICGRSKQDAQRLLATAMDLGINFFDHADIYGDGESERVFAGAAQALKLPRQDMLLQTKCGIRKGFYDFSKEYIVSSAEGSLRRLETDYVDFLLLHRPDALMEPDEVAEAFARLRSAGKVRYFGVSNFNSMQIELLQQAVGEPLLIDQLQFGPAHTGMIDSGINVNTEDAHAVDRDGSILEYCRLKKIVLQAWSPFQYGMFQGVFWSNPVYDDAVRVIDELAGDYGVSREALIVAWIMRHPAGIQTISGTTSSEHLSAIARAAEIKISREEWYRVYLAAGNPLP